MKILYSGGGTLGPVTPLLAIHQVVKSHDPGLEVVWIGTKTGPERELISEQGIPFHTITTSKFRRYISFWNIIDISRFGIGFFESLVFLIKHKPDVCISAGGFVSVPIHWAAWLLGIPTWIHQQDVHVGLANKLMTPFASLVSVVLAETMEKFPKKKTIWFGNPVRKDITEGDADRARKEFGLKKDLPVVLAMGGGTGSLRVNQLVVEAVGHLQGVCQVMHISGKERPQELAENAEKLFDYYQVHQFFSDKLKDIYAASDIIVSRGGFGSITEIAALGKTAILIPKPGHQEENVRFLYEGGAAVYLNEDTTSGNELAGVIKNLLENKEEMAEMEQKFHSLLPITEPATILGVIGQLTKPKAKRVG